MVASTMTAATDSSKTLHSFPDDDRRDATEFEVGVCCTCWGGSNSRRRRRGSRGRGEHKKSHLEGSNVDGDSVYFDCLNGASVSWDSCDPQYFFDAVESPLADDEYPIVFTTSIKPKPYVTMQEPETLLAPMEKSEVARGMTVHGNDASYGDHNHPSLIQPDEPSLDLSPTRRASKRLQQILRRGTIEHRRALESPRVKVLLKGYPGELTVEELAECQRFIRELKQRDQSLSEQVFSFRAIEDEPYSICRFLRATKFDADQMLDRLERNKEIWLRAKNNNFYPDVGQAIGAPFSVFLTQYPFVSIGRGRNGCPVNYFQAGRIQPEGIMCLTTAEKTEPYFWHSFMYKFSDKIREAKAADPNFVRCEGINIIDLKGLSRSALSSETFDVIKVASKISDFFPETLHCMLVLNAPGFFAMSWGIIKQFIDPRTAKRIQVFSNEDKGQMRLNELVAPSEIPSDYGGLGTSIARALLDQTANKGVKRQDHKLIFLKKAGTATCTFQIGLGDRLTIRAYTRSASGAKFALFRDLSEEVEQKKRNGEKIREVNAHAAFPDEDNDDGISVEKAKKNEPSKAVCLPNCTMIASDVRGPGTFIVDGYDLDDAPKKYAGQSRGYFLVVCDVT